MSRTAILACCLVAWIGSVEGRAAAPPAKPRLDRHGDPLPLHATARLGTVRFHDVRRAVSLAFTGDGKTLAAANYGGVLLWHFPDGRRAGWQPLTPHDESPSAPCLFRSRDGLCVVAREEGGVIVRDALTGKQIRRLPNDSLVPESVSSDGKLAATRRGRDEIVLWDFTTGKKLFSLDESSGGSLQTHAVAFTPDGKALASAGPGEDWEAELQFWDVKTGKPLRRLAAGPMMLPHAVAFSPDGKVVAVAACMLFEARRATSERDYSLTLHDAVSGKVLRRLDDFGRFGEALAFSPDGKTLAVGRHGPIELYDVATGKTLTPQGHKRPLRGVAFRPSGKEVVTAGDDETVRVWSTAGEPGEVLSLQKQRPWGLSLSADGGRAAWLAEDGPHVRDLASKKELTRIQTGKAVARYLSLSPGGNTLALVTQPAGKDTSDDKDNSLRLYDLTRGVPARLPDPEEKTQPHDLSADGRTLVLVGRSHVTVRRAGGVRRPLRIAYEGTGVTCAALSADARTLATCQADGTITLWEVASGKRRGPAMTHPPAKGASAYGPLALSPDGRLLASGGHRYTRYRPLARGPDRDGVIRLWDVSTSAEVCRFAGHHDTVTALAFAHGGEALASGGEDHTALVWEIVGVPRRPAPSARRVRACWDDLSSDDATKAHQAVWDLCAAPREAVALLWGRVEPVPFVSPKRVLRWVAEMDSDDPDVREAATKVLAEAGEGALPAALEAAKSPSVEVRRRAAMVIDALTEPAASGQTLRALRAVEALERIGTDEARRLLLRLAGGAPEARLTQDADAALRRLARR